MDLVPVPTETLLRTAVGVRAARRLKGASLREIGRLGVAELTATYNLSPKAAEKLVAVSEIARRAAQEPLARGQAFRSSKDIYTHFGALLRDVKVERVFVVTLDARHRVISVFMVSQGTLTSSPVAPREVYARAIREHAAALVMVHSHPSGESRASQVDLEITKRIQDAGDLLGIPLLDHVIIGDGCYTSLADRGLMR